MFSFAMNNVDTLHDSKIHSSDLNCNQLSSSFVSDIMVLLLNNLSSADPIHKWDINMIITVSVNEGVFQYKDTV